MLSQNLDRGSVVLYAITVGMLSLLQGAIWTYAWRRKLFSPEVDRSLFVYVLRNVLVPPAVFLISIPIAIFWDPVVAMLCWIAIAVLSPIIERIPIRGDVSRSRG